jgi:hypothetical protein
MEQVFGHAQLVVMQHQQRLTLPKTPVFAKQAILLFSLVELRFFVSQLVTQRPQR